MNAGTVSQLNFGPRHVLQTPAAAAAGGGASSSAGRSSAASESSAMAGRGKTETSLSDNRIE
eukprot:COSAG06_NODE_48415_length_332_cov_0.789700_1_plen_61_part_10